MRWFAGLAGVLVIWLCSVAIWIAAGEAPDDAHADTAIVLGAAVTGRVPSPVFAARIDHAIALYRNGRVKRLLFTGSRSPEDAVSEAEAAACYALARGVPGAAILREPRSRTTRENIRNAAAIVRKARLGRVLIVSDPIHMRRSVAMARGEGLAAGASPTPYSRYRSAGTRLRFVLREVVFLHVYWVTGR